MKRSFVDAALIPHPSYFIPNFPTLPIADFQLPIWSFCSGLRFHVQQRLCFMGTTPIEIWQLAIGNDLRTLPIADFQLPIWSFCSGLRFHVQQRLCFMGTTPIEIWQLAIGNDLRK